MNKRVTYNVSMERKLKLEQLAIEASMKIGRSVRWTELVEILLSEFSKDAQAMLIHRELNKE